MPDPVWMLETQYPPVLSTTPSSQLGAELREMHEQGAEGP